MRKDRYWIKLEADATTREGLADWLHELAIDIANGKCSTKSVGAGPSRSGMHTYGEPATKASL